MDSNKANLIARNKPPLTRASAQRIMQGLKFSEQVFCSKDGDLYRIATIVHRDFDNEVAVNVLSDQHREDVNTDRLWVGMYVVKPEEDKFSTIHKDAKNNFLQFRDKELKILILLCKSEKDRRAVGSAGFVVIGENLCWRYPDRQVVNILNMAPLNRVRIIE